MFALALEEVVECGVMVLNGSIKDGVGGEREVMKTRGVGTKKMICAKR